MAATFSEERQSTIENIVQLDLKINEVIYALELLSYEAASEDLQKEILKERDVYFKQLSQLQFHSRKAQVHCNQIIESTERSQLLSGSTIRRRNDKLHKESSEITDSLLSVSQLLAEQVKRSEETLQGLASSSKVIEGTSDQLQSMNSIIGTSHKLLSKLNRRAVTDKLLIILALCLFFATVLYIMKKRLFPTLF